MKARKLSEAVRAELVELTPGRRGISHKRAAALGWTRTDARPWTKLGARWRTANGWTLEHCGHPTANWPWDLHDPDGVRHRLGSAFHADHRLGYAWPNLLTAMRYVRAFEAVRA